MKAKHSSRTKSTLMAFCEQISDQIHQDWGYRRVKQHLRLQRNRCGAERHDRRTINLFLMYTKMNHPSEWAKFFDERVGRYRHKHKESGVVRDTLVAIEKAFEKGATNVANTAAKVAAEKTGKKLDEVVVEKGPDKIQQILLKRRPKTLERQPKITPRMAPTNTSDAIMKLSQILANQL